MKWQDLMGKFRPNGPEQKYSVTNSTDYSHLLPIIDSTIQHHEDPACFFDFKGDLVFNNQTFSESLDYYPLDGIRSSQISSQLFKHFRYTENKIQINDDLLIHQNGHSVPVSIIHVPIAINGECMGSMCFIHSNVVSQNADVGGLDTVEHLQKILNKLDSAIFTVDMRERKIAYVSEAIQDIYDIPLKDIHVDTWESLVHPDDLNDVKQKHFKLTAEEKVVLSYRIVTPTGTIKWIKDHTIAVRHSETGEVIWIIGTLEDITQSKMLQQKLEDIVMIDQLTQLPNNHAFQKQLQQNINEARQKKQTFALLYLDIDDLILINNAFGHQIGDEVVKAVSRKISKFIHNYGTVYREFGDAFVVILNHRPNVDNYHELAQDLIDIIEEPIQLDNFDFHLTTSIGICIYPTDGENPTTLMKNAHTVLKRAKQLGKGNCQMYHSALNIETFKSFQLESDLRKAFEKNELYMVYQPKVDAKTQKAVGAEALIRWKHPVWGIVSPDEFIPIAESRSLIQLFTKFVIEAVLKQVSIWERKGVPFKSVSFNLSAKNFFQIDLVEQINATLKKFKVTPSLLEIEITEGSLLHMTDMVSDHFKKLKEMDIRISLDDFGTGYSSIQYLKQYPVDIIKIDRSFIEGIAENENDETIVKCLINMSKGLNKSVVAEGVENRNQFDKLKKMECDLIQGYLFSKPVTADEMEKIFFLNKVSIQQEPVNHNIERRQYYRLIFPLPLLTRMTILSLNKKVVSLGSTEVLMQDIGLGGLCFVSHLRLTPSHDIVYGFESVIMNKTIKYSGKVVWSEEKSVGIFEYGVEFLIEESDRDDLAYFLNKLTPKINANPMFHHGNFISDDAVTYIRKRFM